MEEEKYEPGSAKAVLVFFDYTRSAFLFIIILLLVYYLVVQIFIVKGVSMEPNFIDGELIVIDRLTYYLRKPSRGDDIVFIFPGTNNQKYIKRVIGLPGEKVVVKDGLVFVGGKKLREDYLPDDFKTLGDTEVLLRDNQYFVLGDNRDLSNDSRIWGTLDKENVIGRAVAVVFPFGNTRIIEREGYNI